MLRLSAHNDLIVGGISLVEQNGFNLRGKYVYAANDKHVVASAHGLAHFDECAAAGALFAGKDTNVARAVAEQGEGFLVERGEHQLALFALGKNLAGFGVDYFGIEMVLVYVHSGLLFTFKSNTGAACLGQAVDVIGLNPEALFDAYSHFLSPGLGTENTRLKLVVLGLIAFFGKDLAYVCGIRGVQQRMVALRSIIN